MLGFYSAVGLGFTTYVRVVKGGNNLWLVGGFVPLFSAMLYNKARQPLQDIENGIDYLLARRAATCEMERNMASFKNSEVTKTKEFETLSDHLSGNNTSLLEMESFLLQGLDNNSS
jgi:hypothetical protein